MKFILSNIQLVFIGLGFILLIHPIQVEAGRLSVNGKKLMFNNQSVFLSGVNFAWYDYGNDFGNGRYTSSSRTVFLQWLDEVKNNGGNSVRVWLHVEGFNTPVFNSSGYVTGLDYSGTMISDMRSFLDAAKSRNILVIFVLWNGASLANQQVIDLFSNTAKLQSYIDNALKPMVTALASHSALGAWDIINEPEGSVYRNLANSVKCFDTTPLVNTGAGWTGLNIVMKNILRFINWQADAIHAVNRNILVTVGSYAENPQTDAYSDCRNYMSDACLVAAGGRSLGLIDFYQMHSYSWNNQFTSHSPFLVSASAYNLNKPLIIGEFASVCAAGMSIQQLVNWAYSNGYQGALSWHYDGGYCSDTHAVMNSGLLQLKGKNSTGGLVNFLVI